MKLTGEDLQGKQVVVVDEAIFMGTTLRIVCQMLREAGAAKAHIAIPTPMSNCRCAQYVLPAMPSLADSMPPSKMLDYFGADSLTYIPGQSFLEIARPSGRSLHRLLRSLRLKNPYPARHARDMFSMQWSCGYRRNCKNP